MRFHHLRPVRMLASFAVCAFTAACTTTLRDSEALRNEIRSLAPPPILLAAVGPRALATGEQALVRAHCLVDGREVARFDVTDAYFKTLFTVITRMRELGFTIEAAPALWGARSEAVARAVNHLDEATLLVHLSRSAPPDTLLAVHALSPEQLRRRLVAQRVLIAARSAAPPSPDSPPPSARQIRKRWFTREDAPRRRWRLNIEVQELEFEARGLAPETKLEAEVRLRWRLVDTARNEPICETETKGRSSTKGNALRYRPSAGRYSLTIPADDPLRRALMRATDAFCETLLRTLRKRT